MRATGNAEIGADDKDFNPMDPCGVHLRGKCQHCFYVVPHPPHAQVYNVANHV